MSTWYNVTHEASRKKAKKKHTRRWRNEGACIGNFHFENQNRRPRIFLRWSRTILKEIENIFQVFQSNFVEENYWLECWAPQKAVLRSLSPGRVHCTVFLVKTFESHICKGTFSTHVFKSALVNLMLGALWWTRERLNENSQKLCKHQPGGSCSHIISPISTRFKISR